MPTTYGFILPAPITAQERTDYNDLISNFMNNANYSYFRENIKDGRFAYILNDDFTDPSNPNPAGKFDLLSSEDQQTYLPSNNFADATTDNDVVKTLEELQSEGFFDEPSEG